MRSPRVRRNRAAALGVAAGLLLALGAGPAAAWDDRSAGVDLPWLGSGGRAHLWARDVSCWGCGTGSRHEQLWGRSTWTGEDPYATVGQAMAFLFSQKSMAAAAKALGAGSVYDGQEVLEPKALPYHLTVVMIEPTVVVMSFDLGALVHLGDPREGQAVGTPYLDSWVAYGTRIPATGTLLWFSPTAGVAPTVVPGQASGRGEIEVKGAHLVLQRQGDDWLVSGR